MQQNQQDIMISVRDVKKQYRLGQIGGGTLRGDLQSWWARKRGKEDPNTLVGTDQRLIGTTFMALNGVSFTVKKGEALGIIGANGAGKSTLLKLLTHVTAPSEGDIDIYGRVASMLEVGTGFHPEMTGRENIYMNGAILGMTREEIDAKMEQIIDFSEVREFIDTPVKRYSSGMYVKLAFSVAAHLDSEIMIMDEVLAVGDIKFQQKCLTKMQQAAREQGRTVLYVSHNMNTIRQLCDRCIVLDKGKIVYDGDVEGAISKYTGNRDVGLPVFYDMDGVGRPPYGHGKWLYINSVRLLNKEIAVFAHDEKLMFQITFTAKKDLEQLRLYFCLYARGDTVVGTAQSNGSFGDVREGEQKTFEFSFDISNLAEGSYYFRPDIYSINSERVHQSYDHPLRNVKFEVVDKEPSGLKWRIATNGYIRLNDIQIAGEVK